MKPFLIVICGATATGKSQLALSLAQRLNSIIISADSRQVYREFDIGTAKPTLAERQSVPHYLLDICDPTAVLTLAQYQEQAKPLIEESVSFPLLVGGTGLYIKSIVKGLKIPRAQLYHFLAQIDPIAAQKIHPHDEVRTLRALEVFYVTGEPISQQQGENPPDYPILQIGLDCETETLKKRIEYRTAKMVELGLIEEVKRLGQKYGWNLPLFQTLGYAEMKQYLLEEISLEEAKRLTVLHTRQFAKRQRTWFRAYPEIEWFDADSPDLLEQVWTRIKQGLGVRS
jgi:tRNA dimethylallyltransferase